MKRLFIAVVALLALFSFLRDRGATAANAATSPQTAANSFYLPQHEAATVLKIRPR